MTYCSEPSAWTVNSFCDLTLKSTLASIQRVPSPHFIPALPPSRPWIRIAVSQGAPPDLLGFFHKLTSGPCQGMWGLGCQLLTDTRHYGNQLRQLIVNQGKLASDIMFVYRNYSQHSQCLTHVPHGQQGNTVRRLSFSFRKLLKTLVVLVSICLAEVSLNKIIKLWPCSLASLRSKKWTLKIM